MSVATIVGKIRQLQRIQAQAHPKNIALPPPKPTTRPEEVSPAAHDLLDFIPLISPRWERPEHLHRIAELFARAEHEEVRALVSVPPQHGKTETILHGCAWLLRRHPDWPIGYTSFAADIAKSKSRSARDYALRAGVKLRDDSASVSEWRTPDGGGMLARGIGGALTSMGLKVLIVDDPHKDRQEAESALSRQRVHDWYTSTARPRVHPGGSIIVVHCMTGDTPVMLADGTQKPLRAVRRGDAIATYVDKALSSSRVVNWANQGPDAVFAITTASGTTVRANERHPFLVRHDDGSETWTKVRELRIGSKLLRTVLLTEPTEAYCAAPSAAPNPHDARGCATGTTSRLAGQADTELRRSMPERTERTTSSTATASPPTVSMRCSARRAGSAPSAESLPTSETARLAGRDSASTTTTSQGAFADCSAISATSLSGMDALPNASSSPLDTYASEPDAVVSIVPAGDEDVFDIQVDGTENFIANGLVSHNTRWHEDDLIGRLSKESESCPDGSTQPAWEIINLPAIDEAGHPLWHQRPLPFLEKARAANEYDWWSLYMGSPRPRGTAVFRGAKFYTELPKVFRVGKGLDLAYTAKTHADFSVGLVLLEAEGLYYVAEVRRAQAEVPVFAGELEALDVSYPIGRWHWFCSTTEKGVAQVLSEHGPNIEAVRAAADKFVRAQGVASAWNEGRVLVPRDAPWLKAFVDEVGRFTGVGDRHDDMVDALASAFASLKQTPRVHASAIVTENFDDMSLG